MAEFKEELVINALHPEKAEVGKKYWYSDGILWLKRSVENNEPHATLKNFESPFFEVDKSENLTNKYSLLYPYEEPPKQRMTYRQLAEWCAKCNGEYTHCSYDNSYTGFAYKKGTENDELTEGYFIRPWNSSDWIVPTVDIYEKDCQHTDNIL